MSTPAYAPLQQIVACFAVHALWQIPLLTGAAFIAIRLGKPPLHIAHRLLCGTLLLCVLLPVWSTVLSRAAALRAERVQAEVQLDALTYAGTLPVFQRESRWVRFLHTHVSRRDGLQPVALILPLPWAFGITAGYSIVTLLFALRLIIAWRRMRRLVRNASRQFVPAAILRRLQDHCSLLHIPEPECRISNGIPGPAIAGVRHPVLLLPPAVNGFTALEVDAVLAHELMHLRRRDPLVHALCAWLVLPLSFHPLALWLGARIRHTREMACDAEAVTHFGSAPKYADALLRVAESALPASASRWSVPAIFNTGLLGMFNTKGTMEERMQMLMNENKGVVRGHAVRLAGCIVIVCVAVLAAGMLQVQPALAGGRSAQQAIPVPPPATGESTQVDADQRAALSGEEHIREQLQHARHQLRQAQQKAATDDDRKKIAAAQQMLAAAQHQLDGPGDHALRLNLDLDALHTINSPEFQMQLQKQVEQANEISKVAMDRINSPEIQMELKKAMNIDMAKMQADMKRQVARMNSPEFKLEMKRAQSIDPEKLSAIVNDAMRQAQAAMEHSHISVLLQPDGSQMIARNDMPLVMIPSTSADGSAPLKVDAKVMAGNVLTKRNPVYPAEAKEKKIEGEVVLHGLIDETGKVEQLSVISSPDEMLSKSAIEAVREWTYKPYLLNGQPKAVETTVTVHYSLAK